MLLFYGANTTYPNGLLFSLINTLFE